MQPLEIRVNCIYICLLYIHLLIVYTFVNCLHILLIRKCQMKAIVAINSLLGCQGVLSSKLVKKVSNTFMHRHTFLAVQSSLPIRDKIFQIYYPKGCPNLLIFELTRRV